MEGRVVVKHELKSAPDVFFFVCFCTGFFKLLKPDFESATFKGRNC